MKVLSLFDGMSCGQIALNRLGLKVEAYYASEIKKHAIKCTKANYPDTVEIGDVRKVHYSEGTLTTENGVFEVGAIDLLIGGSPCQDLSNMMSNRKGLEGEKSSLFWEYVRVLSEAKPKFFMLENVGSMEERDAATITQTLGVPGFRINSSLVSAQFRDRIYWTNIPGEETNLFGERLITQPKDRNIRLQDILESGSTDRDKALCLLARGGGRWSHVLENDKFKAKHIQEQMMRRYNKGFDTVIFEDNYVRLLSRRELERLQTVPEGYTDCVSYVEAFNLLGDGWTIDVITHVLKGLKEFFV